jgi:hypothetical protein
VSAEAKTYRTTPVVTFDQPLYWKATSILQSENNDSPLKDVVLIPGGFHLQMSFLGSVGHLMQATGLQDALETVYASKAVDNMMSGKAVSRAVREHLLVYSALVMMLTSDIYGIPLPIENNQTSVEKVSESVDVAQEDLPGYRSEAIDTQSDLKELETISVLYDKSINKEIAPASVKENEVFQNVKMKLDSK